MDRAKNDGKTAKLFFLNFYILLTSVEGFIFIPQVVEAYVLAWLSDPSIAQLAVDCWRSDSQSMLPWCNLGTPSDHN
jgi:hypothetical protein